MKTLLQGKPYTDSLHTDISKTFARERRRLAAEKAKVVAPKPVASVTPLARKAGK